MIQVTDVEKTFGELKVLRQVSFSLSKGEQIAIRGASGSGKSTLLYLMGGLDRAAGGEIEINGEAIHKYNDEELANFRNRSIGFVFQFHFLLPSMNCEDNILLPAKIGGHKVTRVREHIRALADHLGVVDELKKYPAQLSGGQQQRINLIRAISLNPPVLLCDEPTGNLDSDNSKRVVELLQNISAESGSTLVVVTHDANVAGRLNRQFEMIDGQLHDAPPSL